MPILKRPKDSSKPKAYVRARKQEADTAKRLNARATPMSGAGSVKGDVRKQKVVRIECKATSAKSFSVTQEMLNKIEDAAALADEVPFIEIEFLSPTGGKTRRVCVVPAYVLDEYVKMKEGN